MNWRSVASWTGGKATFLKPLICVRGEYLDGEGALADDDDVIAGVLLADELDLLARQLFEALDEEDLGALVPPDAEGEFHVEPRLLDGLQQLQLLLAGGLVALDHHRPALAGVDVGLVLDEVLDPGLVVAGEDGVVVREEAVADALVGRRLEELVDLDVVDEVVVLRDEDHQRDEQVDRHDQEPHD